MLANTDEGLEGQPQKNNKEEKEIEFNERNTAV